MFDVARVAGKFRSLNLEKATHLIELFGKSNVDELGEILAKGDGDRLVSFLRKATREGNEDLVALVHKSMKDGPEVLEDSIKHIDAAKSEYASFKRGVDNIGHNPPDPGLAGMARGAPELKILSSIVTESLPAVGNKLIKSEVAVISAADTAIASAKTGEPNLKPLADAAEELANGVSESVSVLKRGDDVAKALPADAPADGIKIFDASKEAVDKKTAEALDTAADKVVEVEKSLDGVELSAEQAKHLADTKESLVKAAKNAEEGKTRFGKLSKYIKAGFAWNVAKTIGSTALLGATYLGYKHMTKDDDSKRSETPGARGTIGAPVEEKISTEEAIKEYLKSGDTAGLADALSNSRYSNLMIFPDPIDGLSFAFFDSGRLRSPDERVLVPTHPETQAILNSINGRAGSKVLDYERSKASSPQIALNKTVQAIYQYGFYATPLGETRASKYIMGRAFKPFPRRGFLGRKAERISPAERRERRPGRRMTASDKSNRLSKLDILNKISLDKSISTNNHQNTDVTLFKEADETSKSYYKDAVKDLSSGDKSIREYFAGLGRLYDEKSEKPKTDFSSLYNITDGSGSETTQEAHPKAIVVLDSIGDGGLAENGLEQSEKSQGVAMSTPTGNYRSNYAWVRNVLEKKGLK